MESEFSLGLIGDPLPTLGGSTRVRYLVSDAISEQAKTRQKEGRPDKAGLLRYIASQIRIGRPPSKKSMKKAKKDIEAVREAIVDGVAIGDYSIYRRA
ncbi:hypothetical protein LCGC14_2550250 [marine sediment metagenome]|uniref:Uncharacterized protein n=1 Tax=marine sediment metagenome TaxID=412755 RepID=A0A0F9ANL8_9ZZZZ